MRQIKLRVWMMWALLMFLLGVLTDYYFLHILFHQKQVEATRISARLENTDGEPLESIAPQPEQTHESLPKESTNQDNTFLSSLQACAPEIAAQAIATPEALLQYLEKSVGVAKKEVSLENYHLVLPDGSARRIHIIAADNTNSSDKTELRFFKLDAEGYPERIPLKENENLDALLALGRVTRHEVKVDLYLKDKSNLSYEMHDEKLYEFQFNNHGSMLSCRQQSCQCN